MADSDIEVIKELQKANDELWESQQYLNSVVYSLPFFLVAINKDLSVKIWNKEAEVVTGLTAYQALERPIKDVLGPYIDYYEDILTVVRKLISITKANSICFINNEVHYLDIVIYPLYGNGPIGAVIKINDITEKVKMREMLVESEKLTSISSMAAGMAHEINNPLAGILQSSSVIEERLLKKLDANLKVAEQLNLDFDQLVKYVKARAVDELLNGVHQSGIRASETIRSMLNYSRKSVKSFTIVDFNQLILETLKLANYDLNLNENFKNKPIQIIKNLTSENIKISCNRGQIQQVLLNLLKNSADALINNSLDPEIKITSIKKGNQFVLEIEDNGSGMDQMTLKRVFEPFFTTKNLGKGTGVGLSISYYIIKELHGGNIKVFSEVNKFTRFEVILPLNQTD